MKTRIAVVWLNGVVMGFDEKGHYSLSPGGTSGGFTLSPTQLLETCDDETQFQLWIDGSGLRDGSESVIALTRGQWEHITSVLRKG